MDSILITLAIGIVGTLLAAIWTFVVGLAGAPGAIYTAIRTPESVEAGKITSPLGLGLTVLGQLFAMLVFSGPSGTSNFFSIWVTRMGSWNSQIAPA